jgi:hypothetical protein
MPKLCPIQLKFKYMVKMLSFNFKVTQEGTDILEVILSTTKKFEATCVVN